MRMRSERIGSQFSVGGYHDPKNPLDHFGFEMGDVDASVTKLCHAGGKVKVRPYNCKIIIHQKGTAYDNWEDGRAAFVADPDGIWIELLGPSLSRHG